MDADNKPAGPAETDVQLAISPEKVCYIIVKAREFDVKDAESEVDPGSNPSDDNMYEVLEDHEDDPVAEELVAVITGLNDDEQIDLVTISWLGRGDGGVEDWADLRAQAAERHNRRTARYLLGNPMLPDHLEEGLAMLGYDCDDMEYAHL